MIARIAAAHDKTPAQVVLRWHIQRGDIVFPKSVSPERVKSNFEIFDFSLDGDEMTAITRLDRGESGRTGPNPDVFDYIPDKYNHSEPLRALLLVAEWSCRHLTAGLTGPMRLYRSLSSGAGAG